MSKIAAGERVLRMMKLITISIIITFIFTLAAVVDLNTVTGMEECGNANDKNASASKSTSRSGGTLEWSFQGGYALMSTPALVDLDFDGDLEVLIASEDDHLYCLDGDENGNGAIDGGELIWSKPVPINPSYYDEVIPSPTVADILGDSNLEILLGGDDGLRCLDKDSNQIWMYPTPMDVQNTPAVADLDLDGDMEVIFGIVWDWRVLVLDHLGNHLWDARLDNDVVSSPSVADMDGDGDTELAITSASGDYIYLFDGDPGDGIDDGVNDGTVGWGYDNSGGADLLWRHNANAENWASPALGDIDDDGKLDMVTGSNNRRVYCFNIYGATIWEYQTGLDVQSSPAIADLDGDGLNEVIVGSKDSYVYCFDNLGYVKWSYQTGGYVRSSPAIADIDGDQDLEVIIGSNDHIVYCFDGDEDNSGTIESYEILWTFTTGGVIEFASPAVADIDNDGQLEVVIGSGDGKVYCINAGGTCFPGQAEWPMFHHDLNNTGYYEKAIQYGVNLIPSETAEGTPDTLIRFIAPGETAVFNITIINSGQGTSYFEDTYDLSITAPPPPGWSAAIDLTEVTLGRNERTEFSLYVTAPISNVSFDDFAVVEVTAVSRSDPGGATDSISTLTFLNIEVDFNLEISAQLDTTLNKKVEHIAAGEEKILPVVITNKGHLNDTYTLRIISSVPSGWEVSFSPTDPAVHLLDNISLCAPIFSQEESTTTISMFVRAPSEAAHEEGFELIIACTSQLSVASEIQIVEKYDSVLLIVRESKLLLIECEEPVKHVDPGRSVNYELIVTNKGNTAVNVLLTIEGELGDWEATIVSSVYVNRDDNKLLILKVTAPPYVVADTTRTFHVKATLAHDPDVYDFEEITAIANRVYNMTAMIEPLKQTAFPGETIEYTITVTNHGNGEVKIVPSLFALELGWEPEFLYREMLIKEGENELWLNIAESKNLTLRIALPEGALADSDPTTPEEKDDYEIIINISAQEGTVFVDNVLLTVFVEVNQVFDIEVTPAEQEQLIDPGRVISFAVIARNKGNGLDYVDLKISNVPEEWNAVFTSIASGAQTDSASGGASIHTTKTMVIDFGDVIDLSTLKENVRYIPEEPLSTAMALRIRLRPSQLVSALIDVTIPFTAKQGTYVINMEAVSIDLAGAEELPHTDYILNQELNTLDNTGSLRVNVVNSDLKIIGNVQTPKDIESAGLVSVRVIVGNVGEIDADNVVVTLYVDGKEVDSQTLVLIKKDDAQSATFTWRAEAGDHRLEVVVDPDDTIVESDEENNVATSNVYIEAKGGLFGLGNAYIPAFYLLIAIDAGALIFIIVMRKKS